MFLVAIKNPPMDFLVDSFRAVEMLFKKFEYAEFTQDGLSLIMPISSMSNIAYIKELSKEEEEILKETIRKKTGRIETVKKIIH